MIKNRASQNFMKRNYSNIIIIILSLVCLNACIDISRINPFTSDADEPKSAGQYSINTESEGGETAKKIEENFEETDVEALKSKPRSTNSCYDGWSKGSFETAQPSSDSIEAIKLVTDCSGRAFALSLDRTGQVSVWDLSLNMRRKMFRLPIEPQVAAFSDSGRYIAVSRNSRIVVYPLMAGEAGPFEMKKLMSNVVSLAFDPKTESVIAGAADSKLYRWIFDPKVKLRGGRIGTAGLDRYHHHASVVSAVVFHPYGRLFFSADWNGNLSAWLVYGSDRYQGEYDENLFGTRFFADVATTKDAGRGGGERIDRIKLSGDGQSLALIDQTGLLELWHVRGLMKLANVQAHIGMIYDVAINQDGTLLATVARDGQIKVWRKHKKQERLTAYELELIQSIEDYNARKLLFLSDDELVVGGVDGTIKSVDIEENVFSNNVSNSVEEEINPGDIVEE